MIFYMFQFFKRSMITKSSNCFKFGVFKKCFHKIDLNETLFYNLFANQYHNQWLMSLNLWEVVFKACFYLLKNGHGRTSITLLKYLISFENWSQYAMNAAPHPSYDVMKCDKNSWKQIIGYKSFNFYLYKEYNRLLIENYMHYTIEVSFMKWGPLKLYIFFTIILSRENHIPVMVKINVYVLACFIEKSFWSIFCYQANLLTYVIYQH